MNLIELSIKFKQISRIILDKLNNNNEIKFKLKPYEIFVPELTNLRFKNGKVEYFLEVKTIEKEDIDFTYGVPKFYEDFCISLPEFEEILKLLEKIFQVTKNQGENLVKNFIYYLISKNVRGLNEKELENIVNKFIQKLETKTPYIKTIIFLDGIWTTKKELKINNNLKIRRIKASDFESYSSEKLEHEFRPFGNFPYVILKYYIPLNFDFKNSVELQKEILKRIRIIIYVFLLFRFGSVFSRKCIIPTFRSASPDVILQVVSGFGFSSCNTNFTKGETTHINPYLYIKTRHTYIISEMDIPKINKILEILNESGIKKIIFSKPKKLNYINISLNRYQNAFLNVENIESQISYAISCLEALFSMRGLDLKRKLSQRISLIFKIIGFNPLKIYEIIRDAYDVRSDYSHGEMVKFEGKENLAKKILQCARISLLIFIQIDNLLSDKEIIILLHKNKNLKNKKKKTIIKERKRYFIEIIDFALIDKKVYEKLKKFFLNNFKIFL